MAVRKGMQEMLVVPGRRDEWLARCAEGLAAAGFKKVETSTLLGQVTGSYTGFTLHGQVTITATPSHQEGHTELSLRSVAGVDNIYALFSSPNERLLKMVKTQLRTLSEGG
ncbi:hypothetical protein [Streptomyces qinglanensis]|uniref:Uncharacterized protein n=1 Tax=Streptomyces qinglanensis TaxID=943816 RepID=A0A1H9NLR1_9ACTN|nr:hypothetical protein [Streptomyces qinglanensis]SER36687.1 hypothetical protein SAMN05421870_101483 [Streptomyces qinglanensis]